MNSGMKSNSLSHKREGSRRGASLTGFLVLLVVGALAGYGWWTTQSSNTETEGIDSSRIVTVEVRDLIDGVSASGRIEPLARVAVMSRASGLIKELMVDEGDVVAQGQILAELDREQTEAQLAQQRADQASARARLAAAEARLVEAQVRLEDPELEFRRRESDRLNQLFKSGDVTLVQCDEAARALADIEFRLEQARANLPVLAASIAEATANLDATNAAVERGETALRESTIRSPIDGVVLIRSKEIGDGVSSILTAGGNATQMMTLGDLSEMYVEARVDEVDLGRIEVGMQALITVDAHRGHSLDGLVERIAPAGSVDNNGIVTFLVRVSVEDPNELLKPDMTADIKLIVDRHNGALTLPHRALHRGEGDAWQVERLLNGNRTELVTVELGLSDGLMTELASGVSEGDLVLLPVAGRR
ncbi:MAG: HlyD family secretion protein [Planctomycetota bacterium]|jgi:HlyD family secretion protein